MTTEPNLKLRARVAELLGYTNIHAFDRWREGKYHADGTLVGDYNGRVKVYIPDYPGDRNHAMEAVHALLVTDEDWQAFSVIIGMAKFQPSGWTDWRCTRALFEMTPAEICEALLATMGKETAQ